jgi:hypothetical protein
MWAEIKPKISVHIYQLKQSKQANNMGTKTKQQNKFNPDEVEISANYNEQLQVINVEALREYEKLSKHPILNNKKIYRASDGIEYNLGMIHTTLAKRIAHLPADEIEKVMMWKQIYYKISMARNTKLKIAYGTNVKAVPTMDNGEKIKKVEISTPLNIVKDEVIELFGRMFSLKEIHEIILTKYTKRHVALKNVTINQLKAFRINNSTVIQEKIDNFKREYTDMRLSIKRGRLEELVWMYQKRKQTYEVSGKGDDHRLLLQTLEQIRKEAEGDSLRIEGDININTETLLGNHVNKEILSTINIKEIVLARIASRSHVPVRMFLGQLEKSWYNPVFDPNGAEDIPFEEIKNPSNQSYDFDMIERMQRQKEAEKQTDIVKHTKPVYTEQEMNKGRSLKEILLEKMNIKKGDILQAKNTLTQNANFEGGDL